MYWVSKMGVNKRLLCRGQPPNLASTDAFWRVVQTLPKDCTVPMQLVKLGLLSNQLSPEDSNIRVEFSNDDLHTDDQAVVSPATLQAVRQFLFEIRSDLNSEEKQRIGRYCETTGLNRPPEAGDTVEAVREAAPPKRHRWPEFLIKPEYSSGTESKTSREDRVSNEDDPFSSGKNVTKRGGERITGKNPFADPDRIKDSGLHQGGG